jgi:hypothetical protein
LETEASCNSAKHRPPNSQLPTPKGSRSSRRGERRHGQFVVASVTQKVRTFPLGVGSWKLGGDLSGDRRPCLDSSC